jgi:hypothetical protein
MRDVFQHIDDQGISDQVEMEGIKIYAIRGTSQYVVHFQNSEFSFTEKESAENFALELAQNREKYRASALDKEKLTLSPQTPQKPTRGKAFWRI